VGDGLGDEGEGAGGGNPSRRGSGGLAPGKFFANRRRKYAFSRPCSELIFSVLITVL
jgi:hypothetical protein